MTDHTILISALQAGSTSSALTIDICCALDLAPKEWFGSKVERYSYSTGSILTADGMLHHKALQIPQFLISLDAAIALAESQVPGCFFLIGKGRLTESEPLYGAQLRSGSDDILGEGESDHSLQHALLIALLRALETRQPAMTDGKGQLNG